MAAPVVNGNWDLICATLVDFSDVEINNDIDDQCFAPAGLLRGL